MLPWPCPCALCLVCQCCEIQAPAATPLERPYPERLFSVHRQDCSVKLHIGLEQGFPKCGLRTPQGPLRAFQGTYRVKTIFIAKQRHSLCNIMRILAFCFLCHSKVYCSVFQKLLCETSQQRGMSSRFKNCFP